MTTRRLSPRATVGRTARCTIGGGFKTSEAIHPELHDQQGKRCDAAFTTGEARMLARQLIALADRIDLPDQHRANRTAPACGPGRFCVV